MASQDLKRKREDSPDPGFGTLWNTNRRMTGGTSPAKGKLREKPLEPTEIIVIEDDSPAAPPSASVMAPPQKLPAAGRDDIRKLQRAVNSNEVSIHDLRAIQASLREQITDWSLRTQQVEASSAALTAKMEGTASNIAKMDGLKQRLEELERYRDQKELREPVVDVKNSPSSNLSKSDNSLRSKLKPLPSKTTTPSLTPSIPPAAASLGLSDPGCLTTPTLSNHGLGELLRKIDFSDVSHLKALNELDNRHTSRDSILFSDCHTFQKFLVDYVMRGGGTSSYIIDHPDVFIKDREANLERQGLAGLRILELRIETDFPEERSAIKEWDKRTAPPKYVYDLGQLFLRRKGPDKYDLHGSMYSVVIDVMKPQKSVWLVMRPEYRPVPMYRRERESTTPFQTKVDSLNGVGIAKMCESIHDLCLTQAPFSFESHGAFYKAQKTIQDHSYKGKIVLQFRTPEFRKMVQEIAKGWNV